VLKNENPLLGSAPPEIPLKNAPLIRVIAQVRFPLIASIEKQNFIAPFQESIRTEYPVLREESTREVKFGSQGEVHISEHIIWRFISADQDWRLSVASSSLALETTRYTSRDDFLARFKRVLSALQTHINPQLIDRLGVRYIDRITGQNLEDVAKLVRPEVSGILNSLLVGQTKQSVSTHIFALPDEAAQLMARWGRVPAKMTIDPAAIEPIDEPSWLLDTDVFVTESRALDVDMIVSQAREFCERTYTFFRWVVQDEFLDRYGAPR